MSRDRTISEKVRRSARGLVALASGTSTPIELARRLDRLDEAHVLIFHEEADGGAVRATAEAMVEAFAGLTVKEGVFSS